MKNSLKNYFNSLCICCNRESIGPKSLFLKTKIALVTNKLTRYANTFKMNLFLYFKENRKSFDIFKNFVEPSKRKSQESAMILNPESQRKLFFTYLN